MHRPLRDFTIAPTHGRRHRAGRASGRRALHCGIKASAGALDLTVIAADRTASAAATVHDQSGAGRAGARLARAPDATRGTRARDRGQQRLRQRLHRRRRAWRMRGAWRPKSAAALGCAPEQVLVASTGVIGVGLKMDKVVAGHPRGRAGTRARQGQRHRARHHDDRPVSRRSTRSRVQTAARVVHRRRHGQGLRA